MILTVTTKREMNFDEIVDKYAYPKAQSGLRVIKEHGMEENFMRDLGFIFDFNHWYDDVEDEELIYYFGSEECETLINKYLTRIIKKLKEAK